MNLKKIIILASTLCVLSSSANAKNVWINRLRSDFLNHSTSIYAINLRTFNANDINGNGIIEFDKGEWSGTFLNAINRLDELKQEKVTAIHLLPITPVGKMKALGTAGSLYATADFKSLNPQLKENNSKLSIEEQARKFITAAHDRGIAVIVDVPGFASYDMFLQRPELFVKDTSGQPVIPLDWTDVRLLDAGTETRINPDVLKLYKDYADYMMELGVDGIRVDVASAKPAKFWKELIDDTRKSDREFLWLAESSNSWNDAVSDKSVFTPYNKLLEAGFDGYYGSYFNLKNWTSTKDLQKQVNLDLSLSKKIGTPKSVIGSFTTHDELSPILEKGVEYSRMIMWLNATLPINSYAVDGFQTGDRYVYQWANKQAPKTYTDDDIYFVHKGKIDIFNFSRKPGGAYKELQEEYAHSNMLKAIANNIYKTGTFKFLKTNSDKVFSYAVYDNHQTILVIGNLDFNSEIIAKIRVPNIKKGQTGLPLIMQNSPEINNGGVVADLNPGEIQVILFNEFSLNKTAKNNIYGF